MRGSPWMRWARDIGPARVLWRARHELMARAGLTRALAARRAPVLTAAPAGFSHAQWLEHLGPAHWLTRTHKNLTTHKASHTLLALLSPQQRRALIERARRSCEQGEVIAWGEVPMQVGHPRQWRAAPRAPHQVWPLEHPSRPWRPELGDIKDVWEPARGIHLWDWLRARALDGDTRRWSGALARELEAFEQQNPLGLGPHWASGQECAIRLSIWCVMVAALGADEGFTPGDFARFVRLAQQHAHYLDTHLDFARFAVPNNHLLIEAIALCMTGVLFPWMARAAAWRARGARVLNDEALTQFALDGSYCQASHTYQRLALEYLLFAARMLPESLLSPHRVRGICARSLRHLCASLQAEGRMPNWGANDGARFLRLEQTAWGDFRPLLSCLSYEVDGKRWHEPGPWDEALFWLAGVEDVGERRGTPPLSHILHSGGLMTRREQEWFVACRTGAPTGLASQCDLFHVEVWWRGRPVAMDAGSYSYHEDPWHAWFSGPRAHNVLWPLGVEGEAVWPLQRPNRFAFHAQPELSRVREDASGILAAHDGWLRAGISRQWFV